MDDLKNIIESLLFVADEPLNIDRFKKILDSASALDIRMALKALSDEYDARNGGFYLREVAGGFQIRSRPEYKDWIKRLVQPNPIRLSRASLETLSIIAYKQPIIRADIEHIRGVDCGGILRTLLERKLVRVLGRKEIPGRPIIYATTRRFLEVFELKDLKDLPTPKEIEALGNSESTALVQQLEAPDAIEGPDGKTDEASGPKEAAPETEGKEAAAAATQPQTAAVAAPLAGTSEGAEEPEDNIAQEPTDGAFADQSQAENAGQQPAEQDETD